jgi:hypothetical protein
MSNPKTPNYIFLSGEAQPLKLDTQDRRFFAIPQTFSESALDAGVAAWFGVTKVEAEKNFIHGRMHAAVTAVLRASPLSDEEDAGAASLSVDVEQLLSDTVPGGRVCDPQAVADAIRARFADAHRKGSFAGLDLSRAARSVLAERVRQVSAEAYTTEHDDAHSAGQLGDAAACYALGASHWPQSVFELFWPWDGASWKPADARRNLEKAGALILAEMERLDRIADR